MQPSAHFDQSGLSVNPVRRDAWIRIGAQKAVFPRRRRQRFNVLGRLLRGALARQGVWAWMDAPAMICFMNERVKRMRRRTILVLDNAFAHNCRILRAWRDKRRQRGLAFYFLPAYRSELKSIEGLWRQAKYHYPASPGAAQHAIYRPSAALPCPPGIFHPALIP